MPIIYKALYSFESQDPSALCFSENDKFTVLDSNDEHWWLVQNGRGQVGYVPANYLAKSDVSPASAHTEVLRSIDRAIDAIKQEASKAGGQLTAPQKANLQKLQRHRQNYLEEQKQHHLKQKHPQHHQPHQQHQQHQQRASGGHGATSTRTAPGPPAATGSGKGPPSPSGAGKRSSIKKMATPPPPAPTSNQTAAQDRPADQTAHTARQSANQKAVNVQPSQSASTKDKSPPMNMTYMMASPAAKKSSSSFTAVSSSKSRVVIPETLGTELVELVRKKTDLSYEKSQMAVGMVLSHVGRTVPEIAGPMDEILYTLKKNETDCNDLELTYDGKRLQKIFLELAACKDDSQQRSWFLHEDEQAITGHLEDLLSILTNANPDVCRQVVAQDNYAAIDNLVLYYQMETRVSLRLWLLQCFGGLCGLEATVISALLNSILPLELARDMQADLQDTQKLNFSATVLTMIFSMAEAVPVQYYDHLNEEFIEYLLCNIETPPESDVGEQVPDLFLKLLLAFNLHIELPSDNMIMRVLARTGTAKTFTEKLMLLVNRGDDPVRMFEHKPKPPDSLLKFLSDIYSSPGTSTLLYTNDEMVLIDIILRHLADLSPGDKVRTEYVSLIHLIFRNSNYPEHQHRRSELETCFVRICNEEDCDSEMDKHIVRQIFLEFPDMFSE